jgi:hypothetical protein
LVYACAKPLYNFKGAHFAVSADYGANSADSGDFFGRALRIAAHNYHRSIGIFPYRAAYKLARFAVSLVGYGAGVYNIDVVFLIKGTSLVACPDKAFPYSLGFVLRNLAAKGVKTNGIYINTSFLI